ncbi:MAG TPA: spondin domain-containing protein [Balneolales bacterium]|nr:spondin domain-containing protein [Balneolales bacterium]
MKAMKPKNNFLVTAIIILAVMITQTACNSNNSNRKVNSRFKVTIQNTSMAYDAIKSGAFTTPVGQSNAGPILPGQSFEFSFTAPVGARLSLATMFVQSNDWFYATGEQGMPLYNSDGTKITGDVTSQLSLYDAGTEADQEPGTGSNQAPRQSAPNTGPADPNPNVRMINDSSLPSADQVIKVTLMSDGTTYGFKVKIENVSNSNTLQTSQGSVAVPLSPGNWFVHSSDKTALLFKTGQPDYGNGLEALAEDGNPSNLADYFSSHTGLTVPLSPGVFAIYQNDNPLFMSGSPAEGNGLEALAEDGNPDMLFTSLSSDNQVLMHGLFDTPDGSTSKSILLPGQTYSFSFQAEEGDKLTFATMYAQSNDWFYSAGQNGIDLFQNGAAISGDITGDIMLWDAGTEANEEPGIGSNQAPRQSAANTGTADPNNSVRTVDESMYPKVLKVTINPVK